MRDGTNAGTANSAQPSPPAEDLELGEQEVASSKEGGTTGPIADSSNNTPQNIARRVNEWLRRKVGSGLFHKPIGPSADGRRILLRLPRAGHRLTDERRNHRPYISNAVRTSRYTLYDFVPKQIWFQCTRLSNFYFLCVGIPQAIPGISTTGNYTTILPLVFFILLTIVKEGYDDYKRHRLDKVENARSATVLFPLGVPRVHSSFTARLFAFPHLSSNSTGREDAEPAGEGMEWRKIQWRDIQVGDIVKLTRDEDVPADLLLLHADAEEHVAYIETMALDGETNLKTKQVPLGLKGINSVSDLTSCNAKFVLEDPNPDLYRFDGRLKMGEATSPVTITEVLYRGSTLRNTPTAIGLAINTGEECKIRMNANRHPKAKKPALEYVTNRIVVSLVIYVISLTAGCSVGYLLWQKSTEERSWYLIDAWVGMHQIIVGYAIHFNNLIPLALYVSLEITKVFQMLMMNGDIEMYDEASDTPARCNTNTILENLGQVGYVFSDKTGTLTENVMKFRKLSIAGTSWLHEMDLQKPDPSPKTPHSISALSPLEQKAPSRANSIRPPQLGRRSAAIPEAPIPSPTSHQLGSPVPISALPMSPTTGRRSSSHWRSTGRPDHAQPELTTNDLLEYIRLRPDSQFSRTATDYLLAMALCHTCLPEMQNDGIEYQAASPDELALVKAAQELGFIVVQRSSQSITLHVATGNRQGIRQVYEILDVIEFSSKRKRMSIIVRCPDGRLLLICKGADSIILPRLKLAHLAIRKAHEARQSAELEREMLRKSEQHEARTSFGGRPSLSMRRSFGVHPPEVSSPSSSKRPMMMGTTRSKSFEASAGRMRRSADLIRPSLNVRTTSLDISGWNNSAVHALPSPFPLPEKFSFLDDPSISDDDTVFTRCFKHLDDFASEGLRTLLYSQRTLSESEYQSWKKLYLDATTSLIDRQEKIEAVGEMIEQNLELVGATAIEDKLQKGVPETIDKLRRANMKIWMLTGDKRETAINIAHSARICKPTSNIFILDAMKGDVLTQLLDIVDQLREQAEEDAASFQQHREAQPRWWRPSSRYRHHQAPAPNHTVVVVDGHTLGEIEQSPKLSEFFFSLAPAIDSVICCRASPAQKALLVRAVRKRCRGGGPDGQKRGWLGEKRVLTLSIGDGGNDLAMLAEAHVGVGISGREGLQAARVADYSVAQFRFLARLLLVHGRWNYSRTARFILGTFWKEMFFYTGTIAYQLLVGYTGTSLYEMWSLTVLNVLFTSLCVMAPALWEQDLSATTLLAAPELYRFGQEGQGLNLSKYVGWMLSGVAEGAFVFFACWAGVGVFGLGGDQGLYAMGTLVFSVAMMWINYKLLIIETHHKDAVVLFSFFITTGGWWAWQAFLSAVYLPSPSGPYAVKGGFQYRFGRELNWWLVLLVVVLALIVMETAYKAMKRQVLVASSIGKFYRKTRRVLSRSWRRLRPRRAGSSGGATFRAGAGAAAGGIATVFDEAEAELSYDEEDEWSLELWQELEQEPEVRARLERMCWEDENGDGEEGVEEECFGEGLIESEEDDADNRNVAGPGGS